MKIFTQSVYILCKNCFNERAAASENILTTVSERKKMCNCFLELCLLKKYFEVKNRLK